MKRSKEVRTVLLSASLAAFLAGCSQEQFSSLQDCEKGKGPGNCAQTPPATLMTNANRPAYTKKDECTKDFGEENCKALPRAGTGAFLWHPIFFPGRTHYYPPGSGYSGYYNDSPKQRPTIASQTSRPYTIKPSAAPSGQVVRGGFGAAGRGMGGG